jgi:mono/diheme cytochrome c family protein
MNRFLAGVVAVLFLSALSLPHRATGDEPAGDVPTAAPASAEGPAALTFETAHLALAKSCGDCHGEEEGEGGFSLVPLAEEDSLRTHYDQWMHLRQRVADGSMPPDYVDPVPVEERLALVHWLEAAAREAICRDGESPGPAMFRRMAAHEYSNTIRDLLSTHFDAGSILPQDAAGGEGFNNAAETLTISPIHAEKYVQAATDALTYAGSDSEARDTLIRRRPSESTAELDAAKANLRRFVNRAYRRPATAEEIAPYVALYEEARGDGLDFEQATLYAMRGVLVSPQFLFLSEAPPSDLAVAEPLTNWELATRLSYFLWASMPDRTLRRAADAGRLSDPEELKSQVVRMLGEGTHLNDTLVHFVGQWLGTADWGSAKQVDSEKHEWIRDHHVAAMRNQPVYIFESLLRENGSLLELIDSDWTFINDELLGLYKMDRKKLEREKIAQHLVRVKLPEEYRYRSGLLGAGGVMAVTAYPRRSSPVLRGVWVLDALEGVELPPPPPDVPKLDESHDAAERQTLRERLEQHRADPACATCHDRIDGIGFALENFDELGRWRDEDEGGPIDPVGELSGGRTIDGLAGLKQYLLENKRQFVRHLTEKMLGYALARGLRPADLATVETIVARLEANDYRAQELVLGIVASTPFQMKGDRP